MSPIRESERAKYPADWRAIRDRILQRAESRCEFTRADTGARCNAPDGELVFRERVNREHWRTPNGSDCGEADPDYRGVVIVLTVAHLDHDPANCSDDNLKAGCQLHHLRYDVGHHHKTAAATRRSRKHNGELFEEG